MIKFNYILNDLALINLITKCLYSENANYSDKEELVNQIKLIQQENRQLKDNWNKLKEHIQICLNEQKENDIYDRSNYETGVITGLESSLYKMQELEKVDNNE